MNFFQSQSRLSIELYGMKMARLVSQLGTFNLKFYPQESVVISNKIGAMLTISMNISSQLYSFLIGKVL